MSNQKLLLAICLAASLGFPLAAQAQRNNNPNLNHFYMGRQQVQIIDESPMIMNQPGGGAAAGGGNMNGSMPNRPLPLPHAGWQSYTQAQPPGFATGLPKVINGVPPKAVPQGPAGNKAKAGALTANKGKPKGKPSQVAGSPTTVSSYKPYATYKPVQQAAPGAVGVNNQQTTTNVRGNILHWARGPHRTY
ncbi:MAG: hypothetical protein C5B53_02160 [Candidatus Melainabacteria bacterium]|nr:MAG: hypothetical protein C5B53_02160 [Candidatus Melainabacteria bacterium]